MFIKKQYQKNLIIQYQCAWITNNNNKNNINNKNNKNKFLLN